MRIFLAALLGLALGYGWTQHIQITALERSMAIHKKELHTLQSQLAQWDARSAVALKLGIVNQTSINRLQRKQSVTVTAYSPRHSETDTTPFITASNKRVRHGIVAVSRDLFDQGWVFGRKVYIKSLGIFTIDDLMAERKRNQIDIFMFDTNQAVSFGRRTLDAHLLAMNEDTSSYKRTNLALQ